MRSRSLIRTVPAKVAALLLLPATLMAADNDWEEKHVVVNAGKVVTVTGEEYAPGMIVITDGKVALVGSDLEYPPGAKVINARRETVMPGMVLARSRFGLPRYSRKGVQGDQRAASEVFLDQLDFTDLLQAGFTSVSFVPAGNGINGYAAGFRTAGPDEHRELGDMLYLDASLRWDSGGKGKSVLAGGLKKAKAEIEKVEKARKEWDEKQKKKAEEEAKKKKAGDQDKPAPKPKDDDNPEPKPKPKPQPKPGDSLAEGDDGGNGKDKPKPEGEKKEDEEEKFEPPKIDPKHQPLVDLIQKKEGASMMVRLDKASDLLHLVNVLESSDDYKDIAHSLFLGGFGRYSDFHYVVDQLGERKANILMRAGVYRIPYTTNRYNLMGMLAKAGCKLSALPVRDGRMPYLQLRHQVAQLVRVGLSREDALKSLTLHPAELIGLGKQLGSIEKNKDADLVFFDGDPLDPHSKVKRVMILGEIAWEADADDD
ncbi:MAG: amidohydrolase family protein [Planctomycetota bacterium]